MMSVNTYILDFRHSKLFDSYMSAIVGLIGCYNVEFITELWNKNLLYPI